MARVLDLSKGLFMVLAGWWMFEPEVWLLLLLFEGLRNATFLSQYSIFSLNISFKALQATCRVARSLFFM